jgi:hypothetical protein
MFVNGREVPSEGLSLDTCNIKNITIAFQTLFSGLGLHHDKLGLQISPYQFVRGSFMLIFDLTRYDCASDGNTSIPDNSIIRIEFRLGEVLAEAVTFLIY